MWNLNEIPAYAHHKLTLSTQQYYAIKRALLRTHQSSLRYRLAGFPHYDIIITKDHWLCVDTQLNDFPVLVWSHFTPNEHQAIHLPVHMNLNCNHYSVNNVIEDIQASMLLHAELETDAQCPLPKQKSQADKHWGNQ